MRFLPAKPLNSSIEVVNELNKTVIFWQNPQTSFGKRIGSLIFILIWTGLWSLGAYYFVISNLLNDGVNIFSVFASLIWISGIVIALLNLLKIARPNRPDRIILDNSNLIFEVGTNPFDGVEIKNYNNEKTDYVPKYHQRKYQITKGEIDKITLEEKDDRQTLRINSDIAPIEIGFFLNKSEKEWLFQVLNDWKGK